MVAAGGNVPLGYFKDPEKSARTFRVVDGVRYSFPGDLATVNEDGSLNLLGRGSQVINTAGEKVFPEEVEEAVKRVDGRRGLPRRRACRTNASARRSRPWSPWRRRGQVDEAGIIGEVKRHLAGYKAPKRVVFVAQVPTSAERQGGLPDAPRSRR